MSTTTGNRVFLPRMRCSAKFRDRIVEIAARLNLPVSEVLMELTIAGLDSTQDLALRERTEDERS